MSMFAGGMGYKDIKSHVEEVYDRRISAVKELPISCCP